MEIVLVVDYVQKMYGTGYSNTRWQPSLGKGKVCNVFGTPSSLSKVFNTMWG